MDPINCETCGKHPQNEQDLLECEYCYTKSYCSAECREQDWTHHAAQCNTIVAADAQTDLGFVPCAYEMTANERAWKTQTLALPNYMLHHRETNGTIVQTVVPAIAAPLAAAASAVPEKLVPHRFDVSIAQNHKDPILVRAQAPQALIHAHAANETGVKLANARSATAAPTYWVNLADKQVSFPLAQGTTLSMNVELQGKTVTIQGTVPPHLDQHWDRHMSRLGAGLRTHLEQQLALKGLPGIKRGEVAIVRGSDPATGSTAVLAVRLDRKAGTATLVDAELHLANAPLSMQRQSFSAHEVDPSDAAAVGALVKTMEEHAAFLEDHVATLKAIEVDADVLNKRTMELAECQDHLRALAAHLPASVETSIEARAAIKYATRDLQPVGALANPFRKRDYCDDFLSKFDKAVIDPSLDGYVIIRKRIDATGKAMKKIVETFENLEEKRAAKSGAFKSKVTGLFGITKSRSDFNAKKSEMSKWYAAADIHKRAMEAVIGTSPSETQKNILGWAKDIFELTQRFKDLEIS